MSDDATTPAAAPPRVSVVMPAYNAARWIQRAIDSLVTQTFADIEIVVVDDGSTDATADIVAAAAARDPRVLLTRGDHAGPSAAANRGIALAHGEYIARLDADDIALPDRIAKQVAFLDDRPGVGAVGGSFILIDSDERKLRLLRFVAKDIHLEALKYSPLAHPTVMMRTALVRELGGYRPSFDLAEDYDLWLRIAERAELANLPDVLSYYRKHDTQTSIKAPYRQAALSLIAVAVALMRRAGKPDPIVEGFAITGASIADFDIDPERLRRIRAYID